MKIVIAGGGTAGWLASYFISGAQTGMHDITVIESSDIGVIGTGEAASGAMFELLTGGFFNKKISVEEFKNKTDATYKLGIRHNNWKEQGHSYFAPIDLSPTASYNVDYIFNYGLHHFGSEKFYLASKLGLRYDNEIYNLGSGLHFDGHKVGKFFKEKSETLGVTTIDATISDVSLNESGNVDYVLLDSGQKIYADIFIDCTGFRKVIISKTDSKWVSCKSVLTVDRAMPFIVQYSENEKIMPETTATALSSGWMFDIPLKSRRGKGYIYNSDFISDEEAKLEIEKTVGHEIEPIKIIKFDAGYLDKSWNKNVLALGLSSSFLEPLESTSIHNTIAMLNVFVNQFLCNDNSFINDITKQKLYNDIFVNLNELSVDFISLHYQGGRTDSDFWKNITLNNIMSDSAKEIISVSKNRIPHFQIYRGVSGSYGVNLAKWNLAGLGIITPEQAKQELVMSGTMDIAEKEFELFKKNVLSTNKVYKTT